MDLKKVIDIETQKDIQNPDRHKVIHKQCCEQCPSNLNAIEGIKDPETEDLKSYPKEYIAKEVLFVCAWRPEKLCNGICNSFGINQHYLDNLYKE